MSVNLENIGIPLAIIVNKNDKGDNKKKKNTYTYCKR